MSRTARSGSTTTGPRSAAARAWVAAVSSAARLVSDRPQLWVVGGLAWAVTFAPLALLAAVVPAPSVSDMTSLGARTFVSATWPWNVVALGVLAALVALVALGLLTLTEVGLRGDPGAETPSTTARAFAVTLCGALPTLAVAAVTALAAAAVAPDEFASPDTANGGPLLRTLLRLGPLLALLLVSGVIGGAYASAARALVLDGGSGVRRALADAPRVLARAGLAAVLHAFATFVARLAYLGFAILLLGVLWQPIGAELAAGAGFGVAQVALLVGFVAIWLCLVLGGGALYAWGSVAWTRILAVTTPPVGLVIADTKETPSVL